MTSPELCTEEEIAELVHSFYANVRTDPRLGPVFERHIADWNLHLPKMVDFWSSLLRGTVRFQGSPMPKHVALPGLSYELFQQWLALFEETTRHLSNQAMAERANEMAERIAESLWYGYQISRTRSTAHAE